MKYLTFSLLYFLSIILFSCSGVNIKSIDSNKKNNVNKSQNSKTHKHVKNVKEIINTKKNVKTILKIDEESISKFPLVMNDQVEKWINYFTKDDKERFQRFLNRGNKYKTVVQTILKENDIPPELYYLAMIESGYQTNAYSKAKALGVWQFIRPTGKRYDLEINYYVDERRDPIRSTEAAAKYLRDLYTAFQSWHLAISAYNAGEYRILSSIIKGKSRNFWELADKKILPRETRNYVPKFIAAVEIGKNPEKYGLTIDQYEEEVPDLSSVEVPSPIYLKDVAEIIDIPLKTLKKVNPHLRQGITPPNVSVYEIWVPDEKVNILVALTSKLTKQRVKNARKKYYYPTKNKHYHRIKKGQSLSYIANMYKVSINHLKRQNNLKTDKIISGRKLRISTRHYKSKMYNVRRGDNLSRIAKKYKISLKRLIRLNRLKSSKIYPGMRLRITSNNNYYKIKKI